MNESLAVLEAIGARPLLVADLEADALLLLRYGLVLVNADLDDEALERVVERVIDASIEREAERQR
jgi:hypothetical protein